MKHLTRILLAMLLFASFACAENSSKDAYATISWDKAIEMSKDKKVKAIFVDVRTPEEVAQGTVAGSLNIPLQQIQTRYAELPKDKNLLVFCRSGRRSRAASEFLTQQGYTKVYNVDGGILAAPPASAFK
ncbi:MAG: rhodanese-like domain-containing protein [Fibrobacter sp.]|nr:rhodanese-like domain-containing protein [Fibrobacter sp.]